MDEAQRASVVDRMNEEIEQLERSIRETEESLPGLQAEDDASWDALGDADTEPDPVAIRRHDIANQKVRGAVDLITAYRNKLQVLRSPAELERRVSVNAHMRNVRERNIMPKQTAKDQGVPEVYLAENGNFRIGMDARYKSDLVLSATGEISAEKPANSLMQFEEADAKERLAARGWTSFLDRKLEIKAQEAAKKVEAATKREQAERERAEAKAVKDAKKAQEKAERDAVAAASKLEKDAEKAAAALAKQEAAASGQDLGADQVVPDNKPGARGSRAAAKA